MRVGMRKSRRIAERVVKSPQKSILKKRKKDDLKDKEEEAINSLLELAKPSIVLNTPPECSSASTVSLSQFLAEYDKPTGCEVVLDGSILQDVSSFSKRVKKAFDGKKATVNKR
jgi:hypothetical protein